MDTQLTGREQVTGRAPLVEPATLLPQQPGAGRSEPPGPTRQDGWRWIPDPAEQDPPEPSGERERWSAGPALMSMAWAGLHLWG